MKTAMLYKHNGAYAWSANYATGGTDLIKAAEQVKKIADKKVIPLGRRTMPQRQEHALNFFCEYVAERGYTTREQAFHGTRMYKPAQSGRKEKRSLIEKVIDFFYEYEGDENYG